MTRTIALLADTHANFAALDAVLAHLVQHPVDACWFLGDVLGRGPEPLPTLNALRQVYARQAPADQACWLAGNHDWMVLGKIETSFFVRAFANMGGMSRDAVLVAHKHRLELQGRAAAWAWLTGLPLHSQPHPGTYLVHGSYRYVAGVVDPLSAHSDYGFPDALPGHMRHLLAHAPDPVHLLLCAHTHVPGVWQWDSERDTLVAHEAAPAPVTLLDLGQRPAVLNPGSVGFPRGGGCPTYMRVTLADEPPYTALQVQLLHVPYDPQQVALPSYYDYPPAFWEAMQTCQP